MIYSTIEVFGRIYILTDSDERSKNYINGEIMPNANYKGTGKALCGIVPKGKTFEYWLKKQNRNNE